MKIDDIIIQKKPQVGLTSLYDYRRTGKILMIDYHSNFKYLVQWQDDGTKYWTYEDVIELDITQLRHDKLNQLL